MTALDILRRDGDFRNAGLRPLTPSTVDAEACRGAMDLACSAAGLLKGEFGASKVVLFGSLATKEWFSPRSDIDLAVYGVPSSMFFRACAAVAALSREREVNLVDGNDAPEALRADVEREGIAL